MEQGSLICDRMIEVLMKGLKQRNIEVALHSFTLLVNNLGGVSPLEMTFLSGKVLEKF
jgi:dihydroxyacetone kinase